MIIISLIITKYKLLNLTLPDDIRALLLLKIPSTELIILCLGVNLNLKFSILSAFADIIIVGVSRVVWRTGCLIVSRAANRGDSNLRQAAANSVHSFVAV